MAIFSKTTVSSGERRELFRYFLAGGGYIAVMWAGSAIAVNAFEAAAMKDLPRVIEQIMPIKYPRYSAHQLALIERQNGAVEGEGVAVR